MKYVILYLLIINALSLLIMLADKRKAIKGQYRIPEAVLMGFGLAGGSIGCYAGMVLFRHKTRKPGFSIGLPVMLALQIFIFLFFYRN